MKTLKEVKAEQPKELHTIINAVVNNLNSLDSIEDINNYGIDGGYGNFIYYSDTVKFWRKYRKTITAMLENMADACCIGVLELVQGFNCLGAGYGKNRQNDYTLQDIGKALYGRYNDELDIIYNALAWFTAEEVCRMFED